MKGNFFNDWGELEHFRQTRREMQQQEPFAVGVVARGHRFAVQPPLSRPTGECGPELDCEAKKGRHLDSHSSCRFWKQLTSGLSWPGGNTDRFSASVQFQRSSFLFSGWDHSVVPRVPC